MTSTDIRSSRSPDCSTGSRRSRGAVRAHRHQPAVDVDDELFALADVDNWSTRCAQARLCTARPCGSRISGLSMTSTTTRATDTRCLGIGRSAHKHPAVVCKPRRVSYRAHFAPGNPNTTGLHHGQPTWWLGSEERAGRRVQRGATKTAPMKKNTPPTNVDGERRIPQRTVHGVERANSRDTERIEPHRFAWQIHTDRRATGACRRSCATGVPRHDRRHQE